MDTEKDTALHNKEKEYTVYCHFSFRRPANKPYGIFAVAFYSDFEGKKLLMFKTRKFKLWKDHQFVTAIQAYEHALRTIYECQGQMKAAHIRQIMLVTDNSTLAGWIENPAKNKTYTEFMEKAVKMYRVGAPKEIVIGIGLCEARKAEKSYKYCIEEKVCNTYVEEDPEKSSRAEHRLNVAETKSVLDIISASPNIPDSSGVAEVIIK